MLRTFSLAIVLIAAFAVSAQAQLVSNPVLTGWTPYAPVSTYTALRPVAPSPCCTPQVASYCAPCSQPAVVPTTSYRVPTTSCCAPPTTGYRPVTTSYRVPATTVYRTSGANMTTPMTVPTTATIPTTSYYASAAVTTPVYASPAVSSSSCNCRGG